MCRCCAPYVVSLPCPKKCKPLVRQGRSCGTICSLPQPCCPITPCCPTTYYPSNCVPLNCYPNPCCLPSDVVILASSDTPSLPNCCYYTYNNN